MRRGLAPMCLAALFACATPAARTPPPAPTNLPAPPPPPTAPVPTPERPVDRCGATQLQSLVGRPKTEIPVPLEPARRRVVCATCPMTRDYRADRQTILFDAATDLVTSVTCG